MEARVVDDGDLITAGGVTSGIDLGLCPAAPFVGSIGGVDGTESESRFHCMSSSTERLFNAIVILGASMVAGCGNGSGDSKGKGSPQPDASADASEPNFIVKLDASTLDAGWTGW